MRLDHYLVETGRVPTRSKAQQLIRSGSVRVDGAVVCKSAFSVGSGRVEVSDAPQYVSRAALKLEGFLPVLPFSCEGLTALDIGASTGGFTEVLLVSGVLSVDAVDVGTDQLDDRLRNDPRVRDIPQTDIRRFESERRYDLVTSDVSFISLLHILDAVDRLASHWIVLLFKPQFEVGKSAKRNRKGVVTDDKAVAAAQARFESACAERGWHLRAKEAAAVSGKEGNVETCYCYEKR